MTLGPMVGSGCINTPPRSTAVATRRVIVVPGVFGDGPWYDGLRRAVAADDAEVTTFGWGLPKPLFVGNFSTPGVHATAESELAAVIDRLNGDVGLVGHSAGCGVILGALAKCHRSVGRVVLIAPSVSPTYDLSPAIIKLDRLDVFYSDRDTFFLKWRCGVFGTYDRIRTTAAGFSGFRATDQKLTQHPYDPAWQRLGNDGGHSGGAAAVFAEKVIGPLMQ